MAHGIFKLPEAVNETILAYAPGSPERAELKDKLAELASNTLDIPLVIGGKEIRTGKTANCVMPHNHGHVLARYHLAGKKEVAAAVAAAGEACKTWSQMPWQDRAAIFRRAADLLASSHRQTLNAATMLSQSKNAFQAEIDAACELIDFWNFNTKYMETIYTEQPPISPQGIWNQLEQRPLEGFVFAVTPFNFTSIAGNLPSAPALMGNVALWKPASSAVYSGWFLMELFREAGLPDGVINFIPGPGSLVGPMVMDHPDLAGIHFTGSTAVFQGMWKTVGENIAKYKTYPRIVGETGGKDFVIAHSSADPDELATGLLRGAFEYQGQKCSAASRAYIPKNLWPRVKKKLLREMGELQMGDPADFGNFINAVIDRSAFRDISSYIDYARRSRKAKILAGGGCDDSRGFFIEPTLVETTDPHFKLMEEEIFGPVLTVYVYPTGQWKQALELVDTTSPYALTGAVFAKNRQAVLEAREALLHSAGNFYINDKPTGAVVGQQPFGGSRASGTNDKAGSALNLLRWVSPRTVKENFLPPKDYRYPFLEED
ncbi:MAG: L-glutamate gamma-semialdehyde dehydrogenase [Candidatus Krumholzibacteria bacterium]|jgi:1-pyrroline-5-carboxylate dehydrogenase|nr:L-glutamate gamma-semialdehyde dehydrogenase [Candidatus Krumholzibacteria bacterium]MDP6669509.1 L-glutamate gamma-semialdehyde dehydrogenase [Candidatus Krumholzibacteria bacterium]MDP6798153.1 L-glutamate gamma-semialdehyde dehydrogenase [Candidatus Krumholzibacteria bacterium]MDP7022000.1 L-glutamate gamma-semialdehyde dehydrogenase [Candidatus Krumholzibacteria bacterium]